MGEKSHYAIRDRLRAHPDVDTEPERVNLVIGRKIVKQQTYGIGERERRSHPLYRYVDAIADNPMNQNIGEATRGIDLYLNLLDSDAIHRIISFQPGYKKLNSTSRRRRSYYRESKKDIKDAFIDQQNEEPVQLEFNREINDLAKTRQRAPRSIYLFEPEIEFIDYEEEDRLDHAYVDRGEAYLLLSKRTKTNKNTRETVLRPLMDDEHNLSIILDDLYRINSAMKNAGLLNGNMRGLSLEDLEPAIKVFTSSEEAFESHNRPRTPHVPLGYVSVQPLAIWET